MSLVNQITNLNQQKYSTEEEFIIKTLPIKRFTKALPRIFIKNSYFEGKYTTEKMVATSVMANCIENTGIIRWKEDCFKFL